MGWCGRREPDVGHWERAAGQDPLPRARAGSWNPLPRARGREVSQRPRLCPGQLKGPFSLCCHVCEGPVRRPGPNKSSRRGAARGAARRDWPGTLPWVLPPPPRCGCSCRCPATGAAPPLVLWCGGCWLEGGEGHGDTQGLSWLQAGGQMGGHMRSGQRRWHVPGHRDTARTVALTVPGQRCHGTWPSLGPKVALSSDGPSASRATGTIRATDPAGCKPTAVMVYQWGWGMTGPLTGQAEPGWGAGTGSTAPCPAEGVMAGSGAVVKGRGQAPSSLQAPRPPGLVELQAGSCPAAGGSASAAHPGQPVTCRAVPGCGRAGNFFSMASSQCRRASSRSWSSSHCSACSPLRREPGHARPPGRGHHLPCPAPRQAPGGAQLRRCSANVHPHGHRAPWPIVPRQGLPVRRQPLHARPGDSGVVHGTGCLQGEQRARGDRVSVTRGRRMRLCCAPP